MAGMLAAGLLEAAALTGQYWTDVRGGGSLVAVLVLALLALGVDGKREWAGECGN